MRRFDSSSSQPPGHATAPLKPDYASGPPGTGKTLLARAVAGERRAHIEIVNGPALLSKWVGETEAAIREVFERAQKFAPAVILFDEIDSIAPSRSAESAQHQVSVVAQLLVLLDGIEARGQVFVLATTNRPEQVDAALRRPGCFDQVVWMGLPDERGRKDIFGHYLRGLKLDPQLAPDRLAAGLAGATKGLAGADIAYLCQRAAMCCIKQAVGVGEAIEDIAITRRHFDAALQLLTVSRSWDAVVGRSRVLAPHSHHRRKSRGHPEAEAIRGGWGGATRFGVVRFPGASQFGVLAGCLAPDVE